VINFFWNTLKVTIRENNRELKSLVKYPFIVYNVFGKFNNYRCLIVRRIGKSV